MQSTYTVYKYLGETPLEALERLRAQEEIPTDVPMTYAGRLDPAAEGLLIILTGDACKNKEEYTGLDKTYMAEILVGVSTDSYDLLGMPTYNGEATHILKIAQEYLDTHMGTQMQKYPPYSSKTVDGEQLHIHARAGTDVALPEHAVMLIGYDDLSLEPITSEDILVRVGQIAQAVKGDFRQADIVQAWADLLLPEKMSLLTLTLKVGSGFYVRQFAQDLGRALGVGACLYSLVRTEIGE